MVRLLWYLPHHLVSHNGKDRVVFNCSYTYDVKTLNKLMLPGPTLLGVLICFKQIEWLLVVI